MCNPKEVDEDDSKSVQTNNLGLVNLEANTAGGPGIFEIISIVLLVLAILFALHYCNRRFRKRRQRELHVSVQGGLQGNVGFRAVSGAARGSGSGIPMVTFSDPGSRTVALTQTPSAPMLQLMAPSKTPVLPALPQGLSVSPAGLWEQCR